MLEASRFDLQSLNYKPPSIQMSSFSDETIEKQHKQDNERPFLKHQSAVVNKTSFVPFSKLRQINSSFPLAQRNLNGFQSFNMSNIFNGRFQGSSDFQVARDIGKRSGEPKPDLGYIKKLFESTKSKIGHASPMVPILRT